MRRQGILNKTALACRVSKDCMALWMIKESAMKNYEREIDIEKAFIGVSPIKNRAEKVQNGIPNI